MATERVQFWIRLTVRSVIHIVVYHVGILIFLPVLFLLRNALFPAYIYLLFLIVPLQIVFIRSGRQVFISQAILSLVILFLFRYYLASAVMSNLHTQTAGIPPALMRGLDQIVLPFVMIELVTCACLIGGLAFINLWAKTRLLFRLLLATGGAGVIGGILVFLLNRNPDFAVSFVDFFREVIQLFRPLAPGMEDTTLPTELISTPVIIQQLWYYVMGGLLFGFFLNLVIAWYLGRYWVNRISSGKFSLPASFKVPDYLIWPLIAFWALVLLGSFIDLRGFEILAWNGGLIFLFLFGVQGFYILKFITRKSKAYAMIRRFLIPGLLVILLVPTLTILFMILVPGMGVAEIWINFRDSSKEQEQ